MPDDGCIERHSSLTAPADKKRIDIRRGEPGTGGGCETRKCRQCVGQCLDVGRRCTTHTLQHWQSANLSGPLQPSGDSVDCHWHLWKAFAGARADLRGCIRPRMSQLSVVRHCEHLSELALRSADVVTMSRKTRFCAMSSICPVGPDGGTRNLYRPSPSPRLCPTSPNLGESTGVGSQQDGRSYRCVRTLCNVFNVLASYARHHRTYR